MSGVKLDAASAGDHLKIDFVEKEMKYFSAVFLAGEPQLSTFFKP
jgi:hypothetical protein